MLYTVLCSVDGSVSADETPSCTLCALHAGMTCGPSVRASFAGAAAF